MRVCICHESVADVRTRYVSAGQALTSRVAEREPVRICRTLKALNNAVVKMAREIYVGEGKKRKPGRDTE